MSTGRGRLGERGAALPGGGTPERSITHTTHTHTQPNVGVQRFCPQRGEGGPEPGSVLSTAEAGVLTGLYLQGAEWPIFHQWRCHVRLVMAGFGGNKDDNLVPARGVGG